MAWTNVCTSVKHIEDDKIASRVGKILIFFSLFCFGLFRGFNAFVSLSSTTFARIILHFLPSSRLLLSGESWRRRCCRQRSRSTSPFRIAKDEEVLLFYFLMSHELELVLLCSHNFFFLRFFSSLLHLCDFFFQRQEQLAQDSLVAKLFYHFFFIFLSSFVVTSCSLQSFIDGTHIDRSLPLFRFILICFSAFAHFSVNRLLAFSVFVHLCGKWNECEHFFFLSAR